MTSEENRTARGPKHSRRVVQFAEADEQAEQVPAPRAASDQPVRMPRDRWLRAAELAVGDWAPTLREALLRTVLFTIVLVALGMVVGAGIALLGAVIGVLMFLVGRRKPDSVRE
jgi:ABC-type sugar transport system permease subunit